MNNLMSNFSGLALTRKEMKNVTGGTLYNCQCNGVGTWSHNYSGPGNAKNAIIQNCSNGGKCTAA